MQVSVPVVQQTGSKRKRRQASFSSDRSSSPSILVVTHSDAVMKSVRTIGPGFTPPPDYFHASPSPDAIRPIKKKGKGKIRKSGRTADKPIELEDSDDQGGPPHHFPMEEDYLPPPLRNGIAHPSSQNEVSPQNGDSASQSAQYARKKLPTTQQLVHGSSRPDILPRHKIPTKPLGRSPALNRARRERRQARGSASKNPRFGFGHGIGEMLPDESSANDDDEDMFYQIGVFNENGNSNGPSPRALRRLQRGRRLSKSTRPLPSNGHHVQQAVNLDADILPSTSDAYKSGSRSATRSRGRPPKDARRSIHPHIALKMTLSQAGLSSQQVAFMKKGGYATVKDLTREGLACSVADFSVFSSWLDDLTIPQECMQDSQLIRQAVRARVKSIAEEVCVRSTVVWEAAGMMEEGSDVDEDEAMSQTRNGHSHTTNGEASVQDRYRLEHALYTDDEDYSRFLPSPKRASTNGRKTDTRAEVAVPLDPLSDSSGIEFLGVRQ